VTGTIITTQFVQELLALGQVTVVVTPGTTPAQTLTGPVGGKIGQGPSGGGGTDYRFRRLPLNLNKHRKIDSSRDDEEVMTVIAAFLEAQEQQEKQDIIDNVTESIENCTIDELEDIEDRITDFLQETDQL
jgi:hypothetical protein